MSSPVPFGRLLDVLRESGVTIGVADHVALGKLVAAYDGTSRTEFRDAVAALIARNQDDVERIHARFDEEFPATGAPPPPLIPWVRRTLRVVALATAIAAIVGGIYWAFLRTEPTSGVPFNPWMFLPAPPPPPPPDPQVNVVTCELMAPPRAAPRTDDGYLPLWTGMLAGGLLLAGITWLWLRRYGAWQRRARRARLDRLRGPRDYDLAKARPQRAFSNEFLDDLAVALGTRSESRDLDVPRTIERMVRKGMIPDLVFRHRRIRFPIAFSVEDERETAAFRETITELADGLKRRGVIVEWVPFGTEPEAVDSMLFVISSGSGLRDSGAELPRWLRERATGGRAVWIQLLDDPQHWPEALRELPVFPFTKVGLFAAAAYISSGDQAKPARARVSWDDVIMLRALLALMPSPSLEIAEQLRRRFLPASSQTVIFALDDEPLPDPVDAARWLDRVRPGIVARVRQFVLQMLAQVEPKQGSAAHLRWRRDRALQLRTVGRVAEADAELRALASTPIADRVPGIAPAPLYLEVGDPEPPSRVLAIAATVLPIVLGITLVSAPILSTTREQAVLENAVGLTLTVQPVRQINVNVPAPVDHVDLYDNQVLVGRWWWPTFSVPTEPGSHCYQAWATLSTGALAGSSPIGVDVAPEQETGQLLVQLTSSGLVDLDGMMYEVTPSTKGSPPAIGNVGVPLRLPAGTFRLRASIERHVPDPFETDVRIVPGTVTDVTEVLEYIGKEYPTIFVIPANLSPKDLLLDGKPFVSEELQLALGEHTLATKDGFSTIEPQRFEVTATRNVITIKATAFGVVKFKITPPDALATAELLPTTDRLKVVKTEVRGVANETVVVRAANFKNVAIKVNVQPGKTTTIPVAMERRLVQRDVSVSLDNVIVLQQPITVTDADSRSVTIPSSGKRVALGAGQWIIGLDTVAGFMQMPVTVNYTPNPAPLKVEVPTGTIDLVVPTHLRSDVRVDGKPVPDGPIRRIAGSEITISLENPYYDFSRRVRVPGKGKRLRFEVPNEPPGFGIVELDVPVGANVYLISPGGRDEKPVAVAGGRQLHRVRLRPATYTFVIQFGASDRESEVIKVVQGTTVSRVVRPTAPSPPPLIDAGQGEEPSEGGRDSKAGAPAREAEPRK